MRTLHIAFTLLLIMVLLLTTVGVALAAPPMPTPGHQGKSHSIHGTVLSKAENSFIVQTKNGRQVTANVNGQTRFYLPGKRDATFADLQIGDRVMVNGWLEGSTFTARLVVIAPRRPIIRHALGTVTAYDAGKSITVQPARGNPVTFTINERTRIVYPKGISEIKIGDRVVVVGEQAWPWGETPIVARVIIVIKAPLKTR